jgi:hypothetical protein
MGWRGKFVFVSLAKDGETHMCVPFHPRPSAPLLFDWGELEMGWDSPFKQYLLFFSTGGK